MFDNAKEMASANAQILRGELERLRGEARKFEGETRRAALIEADKLGAHIEELERQGKLKADHAGEWADSVAKGFKSAWQTLDDARRKAAEQVSDGFDGRN